MTEQLQIYISKIHEAPRPPGKLIGRQAELDSLIMGLAEGGRREFSAGRVALISGEDGVGKTELALLAAEKMQKKFSDGQMIIRCSEIVENLSDALQIFQAVIHTIDPLARLSNDITELHRQYISLLEGRKLLIIADQVTDSTDIASLIPPAGCAMIVTSRLPINLPDACCVKLGNLSLADSRQLFTLLFPNAEPDGVEQAIVRESSPLFVHLFAALCSICSETEDWNPSRMVSLIDGFQSANREEQPSIVDHLLKMLFEKLPTATLMTFCNCSVFSDSFTLDAAGWVVSDEPDERVDVQQQLELLCRLNLLVYDTISALYTMHVDVRKFARKCLTGSNAANWRHAYYYTCIAEDCALLSEGGGLDGLLLGGLLIDNCLSHVKQSLEWLLRQDTDRGSEDTFLHGRFAVWETFGRIRFYPENELIPQITAALHTAERKNVRDMVQPLSDELESALNCVRRNV